MKPFRPYHGKTRIRVSQHQHRIGLQLNHQLVRGIDDIPHRRTQVVPHGIHIYFRVLQLQIPEKDAVQVVIVILTSMRQQAVKIFPTFVDDSCQPDYLRARAHDDQQFQLAVVPKTDAVICIHIYFYLLFHRFKISIGAFRVECLVRPHKRHQVFRIRKVDDIISTTSIFSPLTSKLMTSSVPILRNCTNPCPLTTTNFSFFVWCQCSPFVMPGLEMFTENCPRSTVRMISVKLPRLSTFIFKG